MEEFLLILRGDGMDHLSPDQLQELLKEYKRWVTELGDKYIGGQRLESRGTLFTSAVDTPCTDGPFLESKEIIAGYFLIKAADQNEANNIAGKSPHLGLYNIEVRPVSYPKMK